MSTPRQLENISYARASLKKDDEVKEGEDGNDGDLGPVVEACFVDVVWKDWELSLADTREQTTESIKGFTRAKVRWMRIGLLEVMIGTYEVLQGPNAWYTEYRRPYEVVQR